MELHYSYLPQSTQCTFYNQGGKNRGDIGHIRLFGYQIRMDARKHTLYRFVLRSWRYPTRHNSLRFHD